MKIELLREFWILGRCLNFSKAAEELFISQSTLSRHIAAMENELGQRLIKRDTHNVELTQAGIITLDTCRNITEQYQHYLEQMELLDKGAFGYLRLAECYYAVDKYLTTSLRQFKETFPNVTIDLLAYQPHEVIAAVINGTADLGFMVQYGETIDERLEYYDICTEPLLFSLPHDHPLAQKSVLQISDLDKEVILLPEYDINCQEYIKSVFHRNGIHPKIHLITERVDSLNANILNEHAIAIQPEHMMDLPHRGIVFIPAQNLEIYSTMTYIRRKDNQNPAVSLYLKELH